MKLFHFSEEPDIRIFEPRALHGRADGPAKVWAIDEYHAPHYYVPRECPRICVWLEDGAAGLPDMMPGMSNAHRMMAIESRWYERVRTGSLYRYTFDPGVFEIHDANAGYYVAARPVEPLDVQRMDDLVGAILQEGMELRIVPSLLPLRERVLSSPVKYSMIRMRNVGDG